MRRKMKESMLSRCSYSRQLLNTIQYAFLLALQDMVERDYVFRVLPLEKLCSNWRMWTKTFIFHPGCEALFWKGATAGDLWLAHTRCDNTRVLQGPLSSFLGFNVAACYLHLCRASALLLIVGFHKRRHLFEKIVFFSTNRDDEIIL